MEILSGAIAGVDVLDFVLLPLIGFAVAISVGVSGIGGAALIVPALIMLGIPPQAVVGSALAYNFFTKIYASFLHQREGNVSFSAIRYLILGIVPAMLLATWAFIGIRNHFSSVVLDTIIILGIGIVLIGVASYMLKVTLGRESSNPKQTTTYNLRKTFSKENKATLVAAGSLVSFLMQLTSVGAGTILVPFLMKVIRSPRHVAGTSVFYGLVITAIGGLLHYTIGNVWPLLVALLLVGSVPGAYVGVKITKLAPPRTLALIFIFVIFFAGLLLVQKGITPLL